MNSLYIVKGLLAVYKHVKKYGINETLREISSLLARQLTHFLNIWDLVIDNTTVKLN